MRVIWLAVMWQMCAVVAAAQGVSLMKAETFATGGAALIDVGQRPVASVGSSLFIGRDGTSFFRPFPVRITKGTGRIQLGLNDGAVAQIRHVIAAAEAGTAGYDAVQHGAKIGTPRRPTDMTVGEIYDWIRATPGQPHAIGRYQFIPDTLRRLVDRLGVTREARFTPELQDRLANVLLVEAGLNAVQSGKITRHTFMGNLAKIWAGLPMSSGKSYYDGYAGNKATMSWARFDTAMAEILGRS